MKDTKIEPVYHRIGVDDFFPSVRTWAVVTVS